MSRAILEALNSPKQVQVLINEERQTLLLQPCGVYDREARVVQEPPMAGNPYYSTGDFEVSGHTLLKRIRSLTGWKDDRPRVIYGQYIQSHNVHGVRFEDSADFTASDAVGRERRNQKLI